MGVEGEGPGDLERSRSGVVDARRERSPAQLRGDRRNRCAAGGVVVRGGQVVLGLKGDGIGRVDRAVHRPWRESGHRAIWMGPEIPINHGRTGVRDALAGENGETTARPKAYRR